MNKIKSYFVTLIVITIAISATSVANAAFLSEGSRGTDVVKLQTFLISNGFTIPLIESGKASKGYFGTQTKSAVEFYQESTENEPTGSIEFPLVPVVPVRSSPILGAVSGPDFYFDYFNVNGVYTWYQSSTFRAATTTPCTFLSPSATTTIYASLNLTTGTTTATTWVIARSTVPNATTTNLGTFTVASGAQVSTTTLPATNGTGIIPPNTYINWGVAGLTPASIAGSQMQGTCKAVFTGL